MKGNDNALDIISDIMQETYVEISRSITQLENDARFLQWAVMIATRKCYAYLRKNKRYVLLNEEDDTFDTLSDSDEIIPETVMQDREKQRLLREIIGTILTFAFQGRRRGSSDSRCSDSRCLYCNPAIHSQYGKNRGFNRYG